MEHARKVVLFASVHHEERPAPLGGRGGQTEGQNNHRCAGCPTAVPGDQLETLCEPGRALLHDHDLHGV